MISGIIRVLTGSHLLTFNSNISAPI